MTRTDTTERATTFAGAAVQFAQRTELADVPDEVVHAGKRILVDTVGCILAGLQEPALGAMTEVLSRNSVRRTSSVLGSGEKVDPIWAAMLHGTAGVWHDFDSGNRFLGGHPAIHVVPAALASGQQHGVSGKRFLEAVLVGFEVAAAIGAATRLRPGMHPHGTWPNVGAAVASGMLAGLSEGELHEAVNMAASLTLATSMQSAIDGATIRNLYSGYGAGAGVLCAELAAAGFTGGARALADVFGELTGIGFDEAEAANGLGRSWEMARSYVKPHASARYLHPALDAFAALVDDHGIDADQVRSVTVRTFRMGASLRDPEPANELAARFSLPFALAAYAVSGDTGIAPFKDVGEPRVRGLAARISVVEDAWRTEREPDERSAAVEVVLDSGDSFEHEVRLPRWEVDNQPAGDDDIDAKFLALAAGLLPTAEAERMLGRLWRIDEVASPASALFEG